MKALWRTFRFLVLLALSCTLSLVVAYFAMIWLAQRYLSASRPGEAIVAEGDALRRHANELVELSSEYFARYKKEKGNAVFQKWVEQDLLPRLNELRRRLRAGPATSDAAAGMIRAADRLAALARNPDQEYLRPLAANAVLDAVQQAEERIDSLHVERYLSERRLLPTFDRLR